MCGLAGLYDHAALMAAPRATAVVRSMIATLAHRGPDGEGTWADARGRCTLGHRRLSVIDTSPAGRQPIGSSDGRWIAVVNGELYNFEDLRPRLEAHGVRFRGRSDSEVLVNALALWQARALPLFDGMFAFAAFDTLSGELLLARDPFGEKPLYYLELPGGGLAFASEVQALAGVPGFDPTLNPDAIAELLLFQYVGAPRTIYQAVRKLPPGHLLHGRPGAGARVERYFTFDADGGELEPRPLAQFADELEEILARSIRRRLVADVPLGACLSGGVDSSTVCALAQRQLGHPLQTFTLGFVDQPESEHETAREFARHLGVEHHVKLVDEDAVETLPSLGAWLDEPNADWSCLPVYLLSQHARERVTVMLSGDGGDEMFTGYPWYFEPLERDRVGPPWRADAAYTDGLLMTSERAVARLFGRVPPVLAERLARIRSRIDEGPGSLAFRLRRNEAENYLPGAVLAKVDRMSMRHALEVRTPFLSPELAAFAARLPLSALCGGGRGKLVLRELAGRYLPQPLLDLPKRGFGLPGRDWAGDRIRRLAREWVQGDASLLRQCLGPALDAWVETDADSHRLWTLVLLESWCRHHPVAMPRLEREAVPLRAS